MSVIIHMFVAPIHVQTLMEATFVDVILVIYWILMGLLAQTCEPLLYIHIHTKHTCILVYILIC